MITNMRQRWPYPASILGSAFCIIVGLSPDHPDQPFAMHLDGRCPAARRAIPTPKLIDLTDGVASFDKRQEHKQPDWTYG